MHNLTVKKHNLPPNPASLVESMRDIGYSPESAVADIIDNSITANASEIHIRFSYDENHPWIVIIDNGSGMSEDELIAAMRFGSTSPLLLREEHDLGRFGLGLKTASFSQCRSLTVISKKNNQMFGAKWDLDEITSSDAGWSLSLISEDGLCFLDTANRLIHEKLINYNSGTIVLWEKLDRMEEGQNTISREKNFDRVMRLIRSHIELIFHRFISPEQGSTKVKFFFNNDLLEAFDPFNTGKSYEMREETFLYEGASIKVQPYILPNHDKVSKTEWQKYAGEQGYNQQQGFYVYRNRRLIIHSTWFRIIQKEELTKLVRVKIDIPNSLDHLWKIDIKKSSAFPPAEIKEHLTRIIRTSIDTGKNVYKQRGQKLFSTVTYPVWNRITKDKSIYYEINKDHPLFSNLINCLNDEQSAQLQNYLKILEYSFPKDAYYNDIAQQSEDVTKDEIDLNTMVAMLDLFIHDINELTDNKVKEILQIEPLSSYRENVITILQEKGYDTSRIG